MILQCISDDSLIFTADLEKQFVILREELYKERIKWVKLIISQSSFSSRCNVS